MVEMPGPLLPSRRAVTRKDLGLWVALAITVSVWITTGLTCVPHLRPCRALLALGQYSDASMQLWRGNAAATGMGAVGLRSAGLDSMEQDAAEQQFTDVTQLVARCVQLAEDAGRKMREVQSRPSLGIVDKGGEIIPDGDYVADPQTAADREVEELCVAALHAEFPGVAVVAEEMTTTDVSSHISKTKLTPLTNEAALAALAAPWPAALQHAKTSDVAVFIDPLDGTGEFVRGNLEPVTNLIGISVAGVPVAGVINQPWAAGQPAGRTVWGGPGAGVHGADLSSKAPQGLLCTNRVVRSNRCAGALKVLGVQTERDLRRTSAVGYNILSVLEGLFPLFVLTRHGSKKWDSCAGEALLSAVGGLVTDAIGRPYRYSADTDTHQNLCGLLAARDPAEHGRAVAILAKELPPWPTDVTDPSIAT